MKKIIILKSLILLMIVTYSFGQSQDNDVNLIEIASSPEYMAYIEISEDYAKLNYSDEVEAEINKLLDSAELKEEFCEIQIDINNKFSNELNEWLKRSCLLDKALIRLNKKFDYSNLSREQVGKIYTISKEL